MKRPRTANCDELPGTLRCKRLPREILRAWSAEVSARPPSAAAEPVWVSRKQLLPGTLVHDTAALLFSREEFEGIAGIECWAQRRSATSSMHLHFDIDEAFGRSTQTLHCPWRSAVVYLSKCGGPTLMLEHRPGDAWRELVRCHLCWPGAGHVVAFPGQWLHGVVGTGRQDAAHDDERITVVCNLWARRPVDVPGLLESEIPQNVTREGDNIEDGGAPAQLSNEDDAFPRLREWGIAPASGSDSACGDDDHTATSGWSWRTLTVGQLDKTTTIKLWTPPIERSEDPTLNVHIESFTARVSRAAMNN